MKEAKLDYLEFFLFIARVTESELNTMKANVRIQTFYISIVFNVHKCNTSFRRDYYLSSTCSSETSATVVGLPC